MATSIATLEGQGATVVDPADITRTVGRCRVPGAAVRVQERHRELPPDVHRAGYPKTLADLIDFNKAHPDLEGPRRKIPWNNALFEPAQETGGRDADCAAPRAIATPGAQAAIDDALAANDLDAIIAPTNGPAWVTDPVNGDDLVGCFVGSSEPVGRLRLSGRHRAGRVRRPLPIGVSFIGDRWDEGALIGYAYDFEQASQVRVPPSFLPSIDATAPGHGNHGHHATDPTDLGRRSVLMPLR